MAVSMSIRSALFLPISSQVNTGFVGLTHAYLKTLEYWNKVPQFRNYNTQQHHHPFGTKAQEAIRSSSSPKDSTGDGGDPADDTAYFKKLGKTENHHWVENAAQVFERLDWSRLVDLREDAALKENLRRRYCHDKVDLPGIRTLWKKLERSNSPEETNALKKKLVHLALWVPNETHEASLALPELDELPKEISVHGEPRSSEGVVEFQKYCEKRNFLRNDNLGNLAFHRAYFVKGPLAELEQGLVRYSLDSVRNAGFQLISVPDIIYPHIIESCGMKTRAERDQVFWLELPDDKEVEVCLSGTAEMSIGGSLQNTVFEEDQLPLKFAAVSRCFRAETSSVDEEKGIYRVHDFTKVELFGITANETGDESNTLHQDFLQLEERNFADLRLHFKTLEMPPSELGLPAFRKFDIEAWMPGRKMFGEISSCSNCTDFQSRRLNIRYRPKSNPKELKFVHTVNGTACAVPRMLIALVETFQQSDGTIKLPSVLDKFMFRSWSDSAKSHPTHKSLFLRTKSAQEKYTSRFRSMEL